MCDNCIHRFRHWPSGIAPILTSLLSVLEIICGTAVKYVFIIWKVDAAKDFIQSTKNFTKQNKSKGKSRVLELMLALKQRFLCFLHSSFDHFVCMGMSP